MASLRAMLDELDAGFRSDDVDPLAMVALAVEFLEQVEEHAVSWVALAKMFGATWEDIGRTLGVSRQAAWEKYAPLLEDLDAKRRIAYDLQE